ncbi:MAG: NADPH-dependent FMN reductase [Candidatus Lokiarchaeota archaeon]|nr:NADPH-dependent FMN reductase [Candidatus Lokiarchaeota archaeon]MBD3199662.1 NADPH-dependent FMN reductase [Candidatus Lokiarchaeota archaeon]
MKKVIAIIGSARKKATYKAVQEFEKNLKELGNIEFEYIFLHNFHLEFCKGCHSCFNNGEEYCPLKDDRDLLLEKMESADGVILASPNYAFQVSARMKNFLDRFAYFYHRPIFFGKVFTAIVVQGFFGGKDIRKYLETMGKNFGFNPVKGACIKTLDPMTEKQTRKLKKKINKVSKRFFKQIMKSSKPSPSSGRLMMFRISRKLIENLDPKYRDYQYYQENGWFESDYYYETSLGIGKKIAGSLADFIGKQMAKSQ